MRGGHVQGNLHNDDHQRVDREEEAVKRGTEMQLLRDEKRHRAFMLEKDNSSEHDTREEYEEFRGKNTRSAASVRRVSDRVGGVRVPRRGRENDSANDAGYAIDDEQPAECDRGQ